MEQKPFRAPGDNCAPRRLHRRLVISRVPHLLLAAAALAATGASYRTENFIVTAEDAQLARQVAVAAEGHRRALAQRWFGAELPRWRDSCHIDVRSSEGLAPNGQTSFVFKGGRASDWQMSIQGTRQSVFESVLPHEVGHTVLATHFGRPTPRWLEEGVCVALESQSSRSKLDRMVVEILRRGEVLALERMFALTNYPRDALPFYSQGYSLTRFLIEHGGEQKLIEFIAEGMQSSDWKAATRNHYGYESLSQLQQAWVGWVLPADQATESRNSVVQVSHES